ncbi:Uncharacterised protein [Candidatus Venteria ishoeyi]|uniref:Uncharacterized protein n=1 Tax=Candidatus Venteria ishoeyi TaxID=1899563 RepID=A0A1H6F5S9_9GAMM|nr:Uncharacterised protein [Candidatus Venteria ishoeyi]
MPNQWSRFKQVLPSDPLLVAVIDVVHGDGTTTVTFTGGGTARVRGTGTVGGSVYVRGGQIEGEAPALSQVDIAI